MTNTQIKTAAITGAMAVTLGAFGSHGLKPYLDTALLETFRTATLYHFVHVIPMLIVALRRGEHHPALDHSFLLWFWGIVLFSGSLYTMCVLPLLALEPIPYFGLITPVGGLLFILGWLNLLRYKPHRTEHHTR
jgi:uncharacterized membrane protein YgdD (TMEM256/DUF423 family)